MKVLLFSVLFGLYCCSWSVPVAKESLSNSKDICSLPRKDGPCRAYLEMWFYNVSSRQCEMFVYGGCEGNRNRFDQEKTCKRMCEESKNSLLSRSPRAVKMKDIEQKKNEDDKAEMEMEEENIPMNDILKDFHTTIRRKRAIEEPSEDVEDIMNQGNKQNPGKADDEQNPGKGDDKQNPGKADDKQNPGKADDKQNPGKADDKQNPGKADDKQNPGKADDKQNPGKADDKQNSGKADDKQNPGKADDRQNPGKADDRQNPGKADDRQNLGKADDKQNPGKADDKQNPGKADDKQNPGKADDQQNPVKAEDKPDTSDAYRYYFTTSRPWTWRRYYFTTSRPWTWRRYYFTTSRPWTWRRHHHGDARNLYDNIRNYQDDQQDTSVFAIIFLSCLLVVFAVVILFISRKKLNGMITGRRGSEAMNSRTLALNPDEARPLMKNYVA